MRKRLPMLLWCAIFLLVLAASLSLFFKLVEEPDADNEIRDRETDQFTLPTGEVVSNDTWVEDENRYNHLSFRESASSPLETLSLGLQPDIDTWPFAKIAMNETRLFRYADRLVLIIDRYIFVSEKSAAPRTWHVNRFLFDSVTPGFLGSFKKAGGNSPGEDPGFMNIYHFDHLEDEGRMLFLARGANGVPYPPILVYRLSPYDDWVLDKDATGKADK